MKTFVVMLAMTLSLCGLAYAEDTAAVEPVVPAVQEQAAEATFTCPMHPEIVENQAGKCPICGMDLAEVVADAASEAVDAAPAEPAPAM